jgi:hypothetical protein
MAAVAEALTTGVKFKDGLVKKGGIPEADADNVKIVVQEDAPLELEPGEDALMSLAVDNPDEDDDPVEATLIQFDGSSDHVEVAAGDSADAGTDSTGELSTSFTLDDAICDNFCNQEFPLSMVEAIKRHGGSISKHVTRHFTLDCRKKGDAGKCPKDSSSKGGGGSAGKDTSTTTKDSGTDTGSDTPDLPAAGLGSAFAKFNQAHCVTCNTQKEVFCETAPFSRDTVQCVEDAVNENADTSGVTSWANCMAGQLTASAKTCGSVCDEIACGTSEFDTAAAKCKALPDDVQAAVDDCMVSPTSDAGVGASP